MKRRNRIFLAILSGLLLSAGWFEWGHGIVLLVSLVPLLLVEDFLSEKKSEFGPGTFWVYSTITFSIWNIATTWWIFNATFIGVLAAVLINTGMWSLVAWLFHIVKRRLGSRTGYFSLLLFWITWEFFYHNSEISWPWLTLGNGFAFNTRLVQWYEFTGILGGSLWILVINVLIASLILAARYPVPVRQRIARYILLMVLIAAPVAISLSMFYSYREAPSPKNIVVIQPNIDPYQKFVSIPSLEQTQIQINEALKVADSTVDYFVAPETSINNAIWVDRIESVPDIRLIRDFLKPFPRAAYIPGIQCYRRYADGEPDSHTTHRIPGTDVRFDSYNAAIQIDSSPSIAFYYKSKLVVGVEKMPYAKYLGFLERFTVRLGGTLRGWGTQDERGVFYSSSDSTGVGPIICYESVFGEFVTGYVKNGAGLLFVVTNDGWWGNTPGHRQHNAFSCLRAIETRRSIARSANTGISSLIDQRGEIIQKLGWWQRGTLKGTLNANDKITFYVQHGDYIGRTAALFSAVIVLLLLVNLITKRNKQVSP